MRCRRQSRFRTCSAASTSSSTRRRTRRASSCRSRSRRRSRPPRGQRSAAPRRADGSSARSSAPSGSATRAPRPVRRCGSARTADAATWTSSACHAAASGSGTPRRSSCERSRGASAPATAGGPILILTANRHFTLRGIRLGSRVTRRLGKPFKVGLNTWYLIANGASRGIVKARHGRIEELGIANKALTAGACPSVALPGELQLADLAPAAAAHARDARRSR